MCFIHITGHVFQSSPQVLKLEKSLLFNVTSLLRNIRLCLFILSVSGRFKSKETDFIGFITKIHISRYVNPIFIKISSF